MEREGGRRWRERGRGRERGILREKGEGRGGEKGRMKWRNHCRCSDD